MHFIVHCRGGIYLIFACDVLTSSECVYACKVVKNTTSNEMGGKGGVLSKIFKKRRKGNVEEMSRTKW